MIPRIETSREKKLVGKRLMMSISDYKVSELWKSFMPKRKEICNLVNDDLISLSIYRSTYFTDFGSAEYFDKWAAVEVLNFDNVSEEMETFVLQSGLYPVFNYKGLNTDHSIFQYIFNAWLPRQSATF